MQHCVLGPTAHQPCVRASSMHESPPCTSADPTEGWTSSARLLCSLMPVSPALSRSAAIIECRWPLRCVTVGAPLRKPGPSMSIIILLLAFRPSMHSRHACLYCFRATDEPRNCHAAVCSAPYCCTTSSTMALHPDSVSIWVII